MKERPRPSPAALIEQLELLATEVRTCDPAERSGILAELHHAQGELRKCEWQVEAFAALPDFWADIYGHGRGYVSLFSGERRGRKLAEPRSQFFPWPEQVSVAIGWLAREAAEGRELYQCGHL